MAERLHQSVEELFKETAPDLLEFLEESDPFWKQIRDNTITDEELVGHSALMQQLGMYSHESAVAKAVQIIKDFRKTSLPTPINIQLGYPPGN